MMKVIYVTVLGLVLSSGVAYARKGNGTFVLGLEEALAVVCRLFVHNLPLTYDGYALLTPFTN